VEHVVIGVVYRPRDRVLLVVGCSLCSLLEISAVP